MRFEPTASELAQGLECWDVPARCLVTIPVGTAFSRCNCFNPCAMRSPGGGTFCFDDNSRPDLLVGDEDVRCVVGQP